MSNAVEILTYKAKGRRSPYLALRRQRRKGRPRRRGERVGASGARPAAGTVACPYTWAHTMRPYAPRTSYPLKGLWLSERKPSAPIRVLQSVEEWPRLEAAGPR